MFSLGNNAHGQCGRKVVEGEVFFNSQVVNTVPIYHKSVKQVSIARMAVFDLAHESARNLLVTQA